MMHLLIYRLPLFVFALVLGILLAVVLICMSVFSHQAANHYLNLVVPFWARRVLRCVGLRVAVFGTPDTRAALWAGNHITWCDPFVVAAQRRIAPIAKAEVRQWPIVGWLVAQGGVIFIKRGSGDSSQVAQQMQQRFQQQTPVLFYPEATSTAQRLPKPFYPKLFRAAVLNHLAVQPIAISYPLPDGTGVNPLVPFVGDTTFFAHLLRLMQKRRTLCVLHFLPPVPFNQQVNPQANSQIGFELHEVQTQAEHLAIATHKAICQKLA